MASPFYVSHSKIKSWRACRQQYHYRYVERLERRRTPSPFVRGRIIHAMIENSWNGKDPFAALKDAEKEYDKLFREEQEEYGDMIGDIRRLMTGYFDWYKQDPIKPIKVKGLGAEHGFEVEFGKSIMLRGKIDAIGQRKDKLKFLVEHKSHKTLPRGDINYSDMQSMIYVWAAPQVGLPQLDGVAWNYIRAKAPAIPELLKSGELSKRSIDTLWPVYAAEVKRLKLDPRDYADMKQRLEGNEASFFVRAYLPANRTILENVVREAKQTAQEMKEERPPVRTIGRHCQWCEYYNLCQAELRGLDADFIRKHDYREKEKNREAEVEAAEEAE